MLSSRDRLKKEDKTELIKNSQNVMTKLRHITGQEKIRPTPIRNSNILNKALRVLPSNRTTALLRDFCSNPSMQTLQTFFTNEILPLERKEKTIWTHGGYNSKENIIRKAHSESRTPTNTVKETQKVIIDEDQEEYMYDQTCKLRSNV